MDEVTWERVSGDLWVAGIVKVLDEKVKRRFFQSSMPPKRDMPSLSSNVWLDLNDGMSRASIRRVMSPRVRDNLINPKMSSDEPSAALSDIHDGGTVSIGALHWVGCYFKNNSETHVLSLAESTVKPETARPLTSPGTQIRRDEKEKQVVSFETAKELNHELFRYWYCKVIR